MKSSGASTVDVPLVGMIVIVPVMVIVVMAMMLRAALFCHSARFCMARCHSLDRGAEQIGFGGQLTGQKSREARQCDGLGGQCIHRFIFLSAGDIGHGAGQPVSKHRVHIGRPARLLCEALGCQPLICGQVHHPRQDAHVLFQILTDLCLLVDFTTHRPTPLSKPS